MVLCFVKLPSPRASLQVGSLYIKQSRSHQIWGSKREPKKTTEMAVEYFDNIYGSLYGKRWPSMRLALLSPNKHCAVVNNFGDSEKVCTQLENKGAINIRDMFNVQENNILEKRSTKKRKKELNKVFKLEEKLEMLAQKKYEEELGRIYPKNVERLDNSTLIVKKDSEELVGGKELIEKAKSSLEESLANASIDVTRQISPIEGLSSSSLNEFVPVSKLKGKEGFVYEAEHFTFCNDPGDFPITIEPENLLSFPSHLQIYTFEQGNISRFSPSKTGSTGVQGYYLMDAGSILPVLALGLEPGDTVLDMCAAPGGKSLLCLQTLYPDLLVCNDASLSRLNRLKLVLDQYVYNWKEKVKVVHGPGTLIEDSETFSKILVDVPCTNDRHSAVEDDNNIFKPSRSKERILLPEKQVQLLFHALTLVKVGGTVVYSTCSLNPAQNDGVVQMALRKVWEETSVKIVVKDLSKALEPASIVFRFADPGCLRYGSLVVPYLPSNFGPMYFCKLNRVE